MSELTLKGRRLTRQDNMTKIELMKHTLTHVRGTLVDRQRGNISIDNENTQIEGSTDLTSHAQMETPSNRTRFTCLSLWIARTMAEQRQYFLQEINYDISRKVFSVRVIM